jgi:hypothetical protein
MNAHCSDEQFAAVLNGDPEGRTHADACEECRGEAERAAAALAAFAQSARDGAARPGAFWTAQRASIRARLREGAARSRRLVWAGATALLVLAAALASIQAPQQQLATPYDPDHALLLDVERTVRRQVPAPLEPAALLAWEMHRAAAGKDSKPTEERR